MGGKKMNECVNTKYDTYIEHRFYERLETCIKNRNTRKTIRNSWESDKKRYTELLNTIQFEFMHYSLHDESHARSILQSIYLLLGKRKIDLLSVGDLWLILEVSYSHDIGMSVTYDELAALWNNKDEIEKIIYNIYDSDDFKIIEIYEKARAWLGDEIDCEEFKKYLKNEKSWPLDIRKAVSYINSEYIRSNHAKRSEQKILEFLAKEEILQIEDRLYQIIGSIDKLHGEDFKEINKLLNCQEIGFETDKIHPRFVAQLLRVGDALDIRNNRFNYYTINYQGGLKGRSALHYYKHKTIYHYLIDEEKIEIYQNSEDLEVCKNARAWFDIIEKQVHLLVENWNNYAPRCLGGIKLSKVDLKAMYKKNTYDSYEYDDKLKVDSQKIIDLLTGANIYDSGLICFREYLQNAVDAVKLKISQELLNNDEFLKMINKKTLLNIKPYQIPKEIYDKYPIKIKITDDDDSMIIKAEIIDSGIGMDNEGIKALNQIGKGWNGRKKAKRIFSKIPHWLQPTGGFGIGFLSGFLLSDKIKIITKSEDDYIYTLDISSPQNDPRIEKIIDTHKYRASGTSVIFEFLFVDYYKGIYEHLKELENLNKKNDEVYIYINDINKIINKYNIRLKKIYNQLYSFKNNIKNNKNFKYSIDSLDRKSLESKNRKSEIKSLTLKIISFLEKECNLCKENNMNIKEIVYTRQQKNSEYIEALNDRIKTFLSTYMDINKTLIEFNTYFKILMDNNDIESQSIINNLSIEIKCIINLLYSSISNHCLDYKQIIDLKNEIGNDNYTNKEKEIYKIYLNSINSFNFKSSNDRLRFVSKTLECYLNYYIVDEIIPIYIDTPKVGATNRSLKKDPLLIIKELKEEIDSIEKFSFWYNDMKITVDFKNTKGTTIAYKGFKIPRKNVIAFAKENGCGKLLKICDTFIDSIDIFTGNVRDTLLITRDNFKKNYDLNQLLQDVLKGTINIINELVIKNDKFNINNFTLKEYFKNMYEQANEKNHNECIYKIDNILLTLAKDTDFNINNYDLVFMQYSTQGIYFKEINEIAYNDFENLKLYLKNICELFFKIKIYLERQGNFDFNEFNNLCKIIKEPIDLNNEYEANSNIYNIITFISKIQKYIVGNYDDNGIGDLMLNIKNNISSDEVHDFINFSMDSFIKKLIEKDELNVILNDSKIINLKNGLSNVIYLDMEEEKFYQYISSISDLIILKNKNNSWNIKLKKSDENKLYEDIIDNIISQMKLDSTKIDGDFEIDVDCVNISGYECLLVYKMDNIQKITSPFYQPSINKELSFDYIRKEIKENEGKNHNEIILNKILSNFENSKEFNDLCNFVFNQIDNKNYSIHEIKKAYYKLIIELISNREFINIKYYK